MDHSRSRRYSRSPLLSLSYRIDGVFTIHSMYCLSNLIDLPPTLSDQYPNLLQPASRMIMIMMLMATSMTQVRKSKRLWAANTARNKREFWTWASGRAFRMKQIGPRNLMTTSRTKGYWRKIMYRILRPWKIIGSSENRWGSTFSPRRVFNG